MTYHVTACKHCETHWIVQHLNRHDTTTCPGCGTTRRTEKHRSLATADTPDTAAELRAQLLADNAGQLHEYKTTGTYRDHDNKTSDTPVDADVYDALVEHSLKTRRERYSDLVDTKPVFADAFETEAERIAGTVGQHEHSEYYGASNDNTAGTGLPSTTIHPATTGNTETSGEPGSADDDTVLPVNSDTSLTITQQTPVNTVTEIRGDQPVTDVWQALLNTPTVQETLIRAVRELGRNATYDELHDRLDTIGLTDTPLTASYRGLIYHVCKGHSNAAWELLTELRRLGTGHTTIDDVLTAANLFRYTAQTTNTAPTITITIEHNAIKAMPRSQRVDVLRLISTLSHGLNIRITAARLTDAWLRNYHRDDLGPVSNWTDTHRDQAVIDDALTALNPDGLAVKLLREINDAHGGTVTYNHLYSTTQRTNSRVRQVITDLSDLGLVDTYNATTGKKIEPHPVIETVLEEINRVHGQQTTLQTSVRRPPKSEIQRRAPAGGATRRNQQGNHTGNTSNRNSTADSNSTADRTATEDRPAAPSEPPVEESERGPYRTVYMPRWKHAAIAGAAGGDGRVTVLDTAHDHGLDRHTQQVSVLPGECEVAVSVNASSPLSYTVGAAVALASPLVIDAALTDDVVDELLDDVPVAVLRLARQVGCVSIDTVSGPESVRDAFVEWGESIADRSRQLKHGEYGDCESRDEFLSELLQDAHGLYGSVVHVLDAAGYDVLRDVHVPGTVGSASRLDDIAESIAHSVAIQSAYESFAAYRQLYEDREEKRELAFTAQVDAADPVGELLGGVVVRGGSGHRLVDPLRDAFESFELHADAPEFNVPITVQDGVERSDVAVAAARVLRWKDLRVTSECVDVLYGVLQSPFGAARALRWLGSADRSPGREVVMRDVRYAVEQVGSEWVFPRLPASAGRVVEAVLSTGQGCGGVTVGGVADAAGVSRQTVRNYRDVLVAAGVVAVGSDGWRCVFGAAGSDGCGSDGCGSDAGTGVGAGSGSQCGAGRVEAVCREGRCGSVDAWCMVRDALLRGGESRVVAGCGVSDAEVRERFAGGGVSRVVVELGPCIVQEPVVSGAGDGYDDDRDGDGSDRGRDCDRDAGGEGGEESIELDFSGVEIRGAVV